MTIIESGVIAGLPIGAIIGGVICESSEVLRTVGGSLAGMALGALTGWLYAFLILFFLSVVGALWRTARRRPDSVPTEADMAFMTPIGIRGIFIAGLFALVFWFSFGWAYAVVAGLVIGLATAVIAVGRCELR